tara:strand:+ start:667 stop:1746 length:1080 start_codon:yes stop_codon:yes gene_type:complete
MLLTYQKNLIYTFIKSLIKIFFVFFSLIVILNIFEEISYFKNENVDIFLPIFLTLLNAPSILFDILPFIFLISTLYFFTEILDKDELNIYKNFGITNFKILSLITLVTFLLGILFVLVFYNLSSNLKFIYLDIKNDYSKDDKYLAVITANGLWIKDELNQNVNLINAEKIEEHYLKNVTIAQFDLNFNFKKFIQSKIINIKNKKWIIDNPSITKENSITYSEDLLVFETNFNMQKIKNLFSDLSSLNLWQLQKLKNDYKSLGYSTLPINVHMQKLYSYPIYLTIMVCIAVILMLNIKQNSSKIFNLLLGVFISVLIYYVNFFFNILSQSEKIPVLTSVWGPQILLILISSISLIKINEK